LRKDRVARERIIFILFKLSGFLIIFYSINISLAGSKGSKEDITEGTKIVITLLDVCDIDDIQPWKRSSEVRKMTFFLKVEIIPGSADIWHVSLMPVVAL